jgi:hypothetical protein
MEITAGGEQEKRKERDDSFVEQDERAEVDASTGMV